MIRFFFLFRKYGPIRGFSFLFLFYNLHEDVIRTHEWQLCLQKREGIYVTAASLVTAKSVTTPCQGKGSCCTYTRLCLYSNTRLTL